MVVSLFSTVKNKEKQITFSLLAVYLHTVYTQLIQLHL